MAKPSKASVRAIVEALIRHNLGMLNRSSNARIFHSPDPNDASEGFGKALFNETFLKDMAGRLTGYAWGFGGSKDLSEMVPRDAFNPNGSCNTWTGDRVAAYVNDALGFGNLIEESITSYRENPPSIHDRETTTDFFTLFVLNKQMVTEVMNQTTYAMSDFFTGTREAKETSIHQLEVRSLWDIYRNPGRYHMSMARHRGLSVTSLDRPPVQGSSNEKQQLNFARSLVSTNLEKCLEVVLDRQMWLCLGYTDGSSWPLTKEEAAKLSKSSRYRWHVLNRDDPGNERFNLESNNMVLKFTPTKEDDMRDDFEAFQVIKQIRKDALAAVEEQSQILEDLYLKHGKDFNAWLAKELVEKVQTNPMAYVNEEFFKGLAILVMGG